ncbi:beta-ketoacyl reductase, partial [Methylopila musalis]
ATSEGRAAVEALEAMGVTVLAAAADVADEAAVEGLIARIAAEAPPLKGVFHAAAVLDDGPIYTVKPEQLDTVLRPKALGAWWLHRHTAGLPLDSFLVFSSIASLIGSPGQATYVIANAFLDALAHHRRAQGLPAVSVNLGALSEVGMAARHEGVEQHLARVGVGSLTPAQALDAIERILGWNQPQMAAAPMEWRLWGGVYPAWAASPRYAHLMPAADGEGAGEAEQLRRRLAALSPAEREQEVGRALTGQVAEILRLKPDAVDATRSLLAMGVDSLMAMELQTSVETSLGVKVSTLELMRGSSFAQLIAHLAALFDGGAEAKAATPKTVEPETTPALAPLSFDGDIDVDATLARLDELSPEEMERAIAQLGERGLIGGEAA